MAELPMTHAGLQKAITDLCDWMHIFWWHDVDPLKNKAGLPDLLIVGSKPRPDGRPAELWREVKVPPDVLKDAQREFGERMVAAGGDWKVWTPADWHSGRIRRELEAIRGAAHLSRNVLGMGRRQPPGGGGDAA